MDSNRNLPDTDDTVRAVEEGRGVEILDETPISMFVQYYDYEEEKLVRRNVTKNDRNELLYKYGLHDLVNGSDDTVYVLSQDPYAAVSASGDATYTLWVDDEHPVQSAPSREEDVLRAVRKVEEADPETEWHTQLGDEDAEGKILPLKQVHQDILDNQVRRGVVNRLLDHVPFSLLVEESALEATEEGWLFYDGLLLTWEVELRNKRDIEGFYQVEGSSARRVSDENTAFDLGRIGPGRTDWKDDLDRHTVDFNGREVTFGLKEMEFMTTAIWVIKNVRPRGGHVQ